MKNKEVIFVKQSRNFFQRDLLDALIINIPKHIKIKFFSCMNCALEYVFTSNNEFIIILGNKHDGCDNHLPENQCLNLYLENVKEVKYYKNIPFVFYPVKSDFPKNSLRKIDDSFMLGDSFKRIVNLIIEKLSGQE